MKSSACHNATRITRCSMSP
jgi:hypothetical protein